MNGKEKMAEERSIEGKTFLVTGGAGFIGSNFIHFLLKKYPDCHIINLDKLTYAGNLDNLKDVEDDPRYEFVKADIQNRERVKELINGVDAVVHFAAETHVDRSIMSAGEFIMTDVFGTFTMLDGIKDSDVEFFLHVSTDEVYGSREKGYFKESDPMNPASPYSASKAGADRLVHSYWVTYEVPILIVRPSNNFGPYQYPEKFIPLFISHAMENKSLPLYGKGTNVRDWLYVEDNCQALDVVMRKGKLGEAYNIGANNEVPNIRVAERIVDLLEKPRSLITFVKDRPGHDQRYALDCEKIHALGWKPSFDFDKALEATVNWYKDHKEWWEKIKQKSKDFKEFYSKYYKDR